MIDEKRVNAAMDAFYPGEDWREGLGCALETNLRDMRAAIAAADAAALLLTAPEGEGAGLREAIEDAIRGAVYTQTPDPFEVRGVEEATTAVLALMPALTKQPAAQEPAAAGVDDAAYEDAWNEYRWMGGPGYTDSSASTAFLEGWNAALRATLTPAAPKTPDAATGGEDEPEADLPRIDRIDRQMLQHGGVDSDDMEWMAAMTRTAITPTATGGSVGDGGLREAETENWSVASGFPHTAESSAAWMDSAAMFSRNADFYRGIVVQIGEMFGDAAKTSDDGSLQDSVLALKVPDLVAAALAQPAPVGEDETGVREAPEIPSFADAIDPSADHNRRKQHNASLREVVQAAVMAELRYSVKNASAHAERIARSVDCLISARDRTDDALVTQPPKAETPAGVGERPRLLDWRGGVEGMDASVATATKAVQQTRESRRTYTDEEIARHVCWMIGLDHVWEHVEALRSALADRQAPHVAAALREEADRLLDRAAALSTAPAARPGDEVERVRHVKRGTEYEVLGEAEAQIAKPESPHNTWSDGSGGFTPAYSRIHEGDKLTVYRDPKSGKLWCRFTDEFRDGRFAPAAAPAADGGRA